MGKKRKRQERTSADDDTGDSSDSCGHERRARRSGRSRSPRHTADGRRARRFRRAAKSIERKDYAGLDRLLQRHSSLVRVRDHRGRALLHVAARADNVPALQLLARCDAPLDLRDEQGNTPLHAAVLYGRARAAAALLQRPGGLAALSVRNQDGKTASDLGLQDLVPSAASIPVHEDAARAAREAAQARAFMEDRESEWRDKVQAELEAEFGRGSSADWREEEEAPLFRGDFFSRVEEEARTRERAQRLRAQRAAHLRAAEEAARLRREAAARAEAEQAAQSKRFAESLPRSSQHRAASRHRRHRRRSRGSSAGSSDSSDSDSGRHGRRSQGSRRRSPSVPDARVWDEEALARQRAADEAAWAEFARQWRGGEAGGVGGEAIGPAARITPALVPWPRGPPDNLLSLPRSASQADLRAMLREAQVRWHPDKFQQRFAAWLAGETAAAVQARVNEVSQSIHQLKDRLGVR